MQIPSIAPIPEVKDVFALLAFLNDVPGVTSRLKQLESMRDEINRLIEVHGKAQEIEGKYIRAEEYERQARERLAQADAQIEEKNAVAMKALELERAQLAARKSALEAGEAALAEARKVVADREQQAMSVMSEGEHLIAGARKLTVSAEEKMKAAERLKSEFEEKRAKLLAAAQ